MIKIYLLLALLIVGAFCEEVEEKEKRIAKPSGKLGFGYPDWNNAKMWALVSSWDNDWTHTKWAYTWSAYPNDVSNQAKVEWVPMLWGNTKGSQNFVNEFKDSKNKGFFNGRKAVLGFNEPERPEQSSLTVAKAVELWKAHILPLKAEKGLRLGAPAVASDPNGDKWFSDFWNACTGDKIDFIPVHWYGDKFEDFKTYVTKIRTKYNKPIWVTEFACVGSLCNQNYIYGFMGQTTQWLDQTSWVERFAWFGAMRNLGGWVPDANRLLTPDGQNATPLGLQYVQKGGHDT